MKHAWNVSPKDAIELQKQLAQNLLLQDAFLNISSVAGVDVSFNPYDPQKLVHAVVVVLEYPALQVVEKQSVTQRVDFPYVPGLLSFREAPPVLAAIEQLRVKPDLLIVDGQGYAHPRRLGIASHLGLYLDMPTIGCAKSILVGAPAGPLAEEAGACTDLVWKQEVVGRVVRTRTRVQPVYVSAGHKISLESAVDWVLKCTQGYRLPEPTRQAHKYSNAVRQASKS